MKTNVKFKHARKDFVQAVYGSLDEDASLLAVENTESRLEQLFDEINAKAKEDQTFTDSKAIEMCCNKAKTQEELIIFIHRVSAESACPTHPFIEMITRAQNGENGGAQ